MSESNDVLGVLRKLAQRLRAIRNVRVSAWLLCLALFAGVWWRALSITGGASPVLWAIVLLLGILGLLVLAAYLVKEVLQEPLTLARAALEADRRADLKDQISSAYWFMTSGLATSGSTYSPAPLPAAGSAGGAAAEAAVDASPSSTWISYVIGRAAQSAREIDPSRLLPMPVPRAAWLAAGFAVVLALLAQARPLVPGATSGSGSAESNAQAEKSRLIRNLISQTTDADTAHKLEQALNTLERKNASAEEKRKAMADAKEAVDKNNMEMNSMREGLMQLADRLRNSKEQSSAADVKDSERADRAKEFLDRMLEQHARQPHSADADPQAQAREKELEKLLDQASKATGTGEGQQLESAQPKAAVDRLDKIAQQLESQSNANGAMRQLSQMQQLQVAQTSIQSAGRYSSSQPAPTPPSGTPSPDSGNTAMSGGIMFRTAAVAKGDKPSQSQEGSKSGAAAGESQAEPVIGKKETPLAVKLKKEGIKKDAEDDETSSEAWFYAESRQQKSQVALQGVRANTRYSQAEAMEPEQISVKHRQVVKDYFLNLHEAKPQ